MSQSKKLFLRSLAAFVLSVSIALSAAATEGVDPSTDTTPSSEPSSETTTAPTSETTTAPTTETTTAPTTTAPTTEPTTAPTTVPEPEITKHPTGESVTVGETALFVARADGATDITWKILSPDAKTTYSIAEARSVYGGVSISGETTDTLRIERIPLNMSGCKIFAEFTNAGGKATSKTAELKVAKAELVAPSILTQPRSVAAKMGESVTLTVKAADSNDDGTLSYQWYSASSPSSVGGTAINGATGTTYTPDNMTEGTTYYYVKVWSKADERVSPATTSNVASVAIAPLNPPTAATTEATTEPATEPSTEATLPAPPAPQKHKSKTGLMVVLVLLLLTSLGATIAAVMLMRREDALDDSNDEYDDDTAYLPKLPNFPVLPGLHKKEAKFAAEEHHTNASHTAVPVKAAPAAKPAPSASGWVCSCGTENFGSYCMDCGQLKPEDAVQTKCDSCGFDASVLPVTPKFCPNCGQPFNIEDFEF